MRDVGCKLLSFIFETNEIGSKKIVETKQKEIPIIQVEDIYANEYYKANEQGYKPTLRLRISALNYDKQSELIYMNETYTIIRTQEISQDEIVLICERKIKDV